MEPTYERLIIPAGRFAGGIGHKTFRSHERLAPGPGLACGQTSPARDVISVAGRGGQGSSASAEFDVPPAMLPGDRSDAETMLRIGGMWDFQAALDERFVQLGRQMPTFGYFRILLNDRVVFDGPVYYWNVRQWRFWPSVELPISADAIKPGCNTIVFENHTPPFDQGVPDEILRYLPADQIEKAAAVPADIRQNTTFNLSDVQILCRHLADLQLLNAPTVVRVGERFLVEVYCRGRHDLDRELDPRLELLGEPRLASGRNKLFFRIGEPAADIRGRLISRQTGAACELEIRHAVASDDADELLLGHILGGHLTAFAVGHHYRHLVEQFRDAQQGNLVAWLASTAKTCDVITADCLPIQDIRQSGLKVLFRYYGGYGEGHPYPPEMARMIEELGGSFRGFGSHETGGGMGGFIAEAATAAEGMARFKDSVRDSLADLRSAAAGRPVWTTDPSLYADIYRELGASLVGLELFPMQINLNIASVRGTCRAFGHAGWVNINSFECQAYGGLAMPEPMADLDPDFDRKRDVLWWLSLFHSYLAGCRIMYSESGAFCQTVGRHRDSDAPEPVAMRDSQRELFEFSRLHGLSRQPRAEVAYLKPPDEPFADSYYPGYGRPYHDLSWSRFRAVFPNLFWMTDSLRHLTTTVNDRRDYADAPYGEVDLITPEIPAEALGQYKATVLVGRHAMPADHADRLAAYVQGGGQLVLAASDLWDPAAKTVHAEALQKLCGAALGEPAEAGFLWEIETLDPEFRHDFERFEMPCHIGTGAYWATTLGRLEGVRPDEVLVRDATTHLPLLVRRRIGDGCVWLINVVNHPTSREYHLLVERIVRAVLDRLDRPLRLIDGRCIHYFVYGGDGSPAPIERVFVVNTDWFSAESDRRARFAWQDVEFSLKVARKQVVQAWCAGGMVVLPESAEVRIDSCRRLDGRALELAIQGAGAVQLSIAGPGDVSRAVLTGGDGRVEPVRVDRCGDVPRLALSLRGAHRLRLECSP